MKSHKLTLLIVTILFFNLQGCTSAIVVGGVAAGALLLHDRRTAEIILSDNALELTATDKVYSDPVLGKQVHINVTVYNKALLLTGEAPNHEARNAVLEKLKGLDNVKVIYNELTVAQPSSTKSRAKDLLLISKIKSKMFGSNSLDSTRVKIVVENQEVYLMGLVTQKEGNLATDIAGRVADVKRIIKLFEYIAPATPPAAMQQI